MGHIYAVVWAAASLMCKHTALRAKIRIIIPDISKLPAMCLPALLSCPPGGPAVPPSAALRCYILLYYTNVAKVL